MAMYRIGYAPGAFDLLHVGHLDLFRKAKSRCDFLIAGVASDEIVLQNKGAPPTIPLAERLEIIRSLKLVDVAFPTMTWNKREMWEALRFHLLFKGDDWRGTEKGERLEREFMFVDVEIVYVPRTIQTSSTALRRAMQALEKLATQRI
ncbi:MAG: cytidyltransferase [Acidobacteria bacterium]|nr:MAG: cytidyltransferase [Acidobacteriota bacterium]